MQERERDRIGIRTHETDTEIFTREDRYSSTEQYVPMECEKTTGGKNKDNPSVNNEIRSTEIKSKCPRVKNSSPATLGGNPASKG